MDISSLKIVKAQKKAIVRIVFIPLIILFAVMIYLIVTNYQLEQRFMWDWLNLYLFPLIFMVIFDGLLLLSIRKKTNIAQALSDLGPEQLAHIDAQCGDGKISLFKTPLIYTDKVIFIASGLNLQAVNHTDLIWLKYQTATGTIEIVTRQKQIFKIHAQFTPEFFHGLVEKIKAVRPHVLASDNLTNPEGKALMALFKRDFSAMIARADGAEQSA